MRLTRADMLALLIALGAAVTGVVVWNHGTVDLGMTLRTADASELGLEPLVSGPIVVVHDVTPGGIADRNGFWPGMRIIDLTTTDGREVERGEPVGDVLGGSMQLEGSWSWAGAWALLRDVPPSRGGRRDDEDRDSRRRGPLPGG
jgi:hypothetical protein